MTKNTEGDLPGIFNFDNVGGDHLRRILSKGYEKTAHSAALLEQLQQVYWIGGGSVAGKSTLLLNMRGSASTQLMCPASMSDASP